MVEFARVVLSSGEPRDERTILLGGLSRVTGSLQDRAEGKVLKLSASSAFKLGLRSNQVVGIWSTGDGLRLGPYIGIMTNKRPGNLKGFQGLRGRRENYTALTRIARQMGAVAFVFAVEDVDFKRLRVAGYAMDSTGRWLPRDYPLPNVVYNRIPDRKSEVSREVVMAKRRFERLDGMALFNPRFLNKWDLYRILKEEPNLVSYMPETRVYKGAEDILTMLKKHRMVYLKPRDSFAGQGIMRAEYVNGTFVLSFKQGGVYRHEPHSDFAGLARSFAARRRPGVYLVQQGLRLAKFRGAIFDARIIVQKTGQGQWDLTGAGVRVAARGGITTHVPNGGHIEPIDRVIGEVFGENVTASQGIYQRVRQLALDIAPTIERRYGHTFGEMSMDIGITKDGQCFFFEANAKPMKFDEPTIRKKSLRRLVEFSRYLAGYRGSEVEADATN